MFPAVAVDLFALSMETLFLQLMNKATVIPFEGPVLVEQKQIKGVDTIRLQPIGTRKEYNFKFEVTAWCSRARVYLCLTDACTHK